MSETRWRELGKFTLLFGIVIFVTFLIPFFMGLFRGGFEAISVIDEYNFYISGGIFALGLLALKIHEISSKKGDNIYGNSVAFSNQGEKPHAKFFGNFTTIQLLLIFTIIVLVGGLLNALFIPQKTYTGVGVLERQQFTPLEQTGYSVLLGAGSENLQFAFVLGFMLMILGILARKTKMKFSTYLTLLILIAILSGLVMVGTHNLRYGGSELSLFIVFGFWTFGAFITLLSGTFILFWLMHLANNFFLEMQRLLSSELNLILLTVVPLIIIIVAYGFLYKGKLFGKKQTKKQGE